jgi:adenylate kinase
MSELNLVMLGPPGAGKGTQAGRLTQDFALAYIATGDMLRAQVRDGTALGLQAKAHMDAGALVPDHLVIAMISDRIGEEDAKDGFLLDGFPRSVPQADALAAMLDEHGRRLSAVLLIEVPDDEVVRRISGRRVCAQKAHTYHVEFDPPNREGICDQDGSPLELREDDEPGTVRRRLAVYHETTHPLEDYYEERGLLRRFDGSRSPTEVHDHIRATLATLRLEERLS